MRVPMTAAQTATPKCECSDRLTPNSLAGRVTHVPRPICHGPHETRHDRTRHATRRQWPDSGVLGTRPSVTLSHGVTFAVDRTAALPHPWVADRGPRPHLHDGSPGSKRVVGALPATRRWRAHSTSDIMREPTRSRDRAHRCTRRRSGPGPRRDEAGSSCRRSGRRQARGGSRLRAAASTGSGM